MPKLKCTSTEAVIWLCPCLTEAALVLQLSREGKYGAPCPDLFLCNTVYGPKSGLCLRAYDDPAPAAVERPPRHMLLLFQGYRLRT